MATLERKQAGEAMEVKEMQALSMKGVDTLGDDVFSKKILAEVKTFLKAFRKEN